MNSPSKAPFEAPSRMITRVALTIMCCLCTTIAMQAQMEMPKYLFPNAVSGGRHFPRITKAPDGTLVLSFAVRSGSVAQFRMALSSDNGVTWSTDHFFMESPANAITLQRQTYAVMDNKRVLHGVGANYNSMNMLSLYYTRSEDLGATWTPIMALKNTLDMRHMDFGGIAIDSAGTIYVSYITESKDEGDAYTHDVLVRSTDNGATWSEEIRVDNFPVGGSCECCTQNIEVGPDGEIAVAFRSNINNRRDIHVARSSDGGTTFTTPVNVQSGMWMIGGCPATGPTLKYDNTGTIHFAWRDARNIQEPGTCYYAALPRGSTTTPANVNLSKDFAEDSDYPFIAVSQDGQRVGVVWENSVGLYNAYSVDNGMTFTKDTLSKGMNMYPNANLVITPSGPYTVWQMTRGTVSDIALSTSGTTGVQENAAHEGFVGNDRFVSTEDVASRTIYDLMGRLVYSDAHSPGTAFESSLADGIYAVVETSATTTKVRTINKH